MEPPQSVVDPCPGTTLAPPASYVFYALINSLMASKCALGPEGRYPPDYGNRLCDEAEFDFIIVGCGSAGSIVANRLSQVKNWTVLVVEAGGYPSGLSEIPAFLFSLQRTPEDWQYQTEPHKTCCLGLKNGTCYYPRGKALGGSSVINAMYYVRGNPSDFNAWAAVGNTGWDYESVVNYFKKFEGCQDPNYPFYGKDGELKLTRYKSVQPIRDILAEAYREIGYDQEYNETNPIGLWDCFMTINEGTRCSTAESFLGPIKDRENLHVVLNAQVTRLIINKSTRVVSGVEVRIKDKIFQPKAKKEVILSAGSINSPQILMNSGIGPKQHLQDLGIDPVKDLDVGCNLKDHVGIALFISIDESVINRKSALDKIDEFYEYFMHKRGPLTGLEITNFMGFINTKKDSMFPDLQLYHILFEPNDSYLLPTLASVLNLPDNLIKTYQESNRNSCSLFLVPQILKPKSTGNINLSSANPLQKPKISPNYFSDKNSEDLELLLRGIKLFKTLLETETLKKYNAKLVEFTLPNCEEFTFDTDDFWRCAIRNTASTLYHPVGTCKMGPKGDPTAVVDPKLKVHGIKGLRVIDGSIMPNITSGNLNAPIIMIGQKGSDLIKEDWS